MSVTGTIKALLTIMPATASVMRTTSVIGAAILTTNPAYAQPTAIVEGTYKVNASGGATALFTKTQGADKAYSIGSTKMKALLINFEGAGLASTDLSFVLLGNPNRPTEGIISRFEFPILQNSTTAVDGVMTELYFRDADNPNVPIYRKYDSFSDFPKYPLNLLPDGNAFLGFFYLHTSDLAFPDPSKISLKEVKFTLKKPGRMSILDSSVQVTGETTITKNKIDLSN
ncbi:MAG: PE-PPE domain-containing protein [Candidatus Obscuribacterales bacterium]